MPKRDEVVFDLNNTLRKDNGKPRHHILKKAKKAEHKEGVIVLSGESDTKRKEARSWLDDHGLKDANLDMRPRGDKESDPKFKNKEIKKMSRQFKVTEDYDDKKSNIKAIRKDGVKAKKV